MNIEQLRKNYQSIRRQTEKLCQPLATEDYVIQSVEEVSPPKWHLAHTTWFFETFILQSQQQHYRVFHPSFHYLFNSYYQSIGQPYPRVKRGILSRPTVETIYAYRQYVDEALWLFLETLSQSGLAKLEPLLILGLHHEQQHQELLLMDIKHNFSCDPTLPVYIEPVNTKKAATKKKNQTTFLDFTGGIVEIGHQGEGFCFDNELPRHQQILKSYQLAQYLVTNGEYAEFIQAGGYQQAEWWLADAWDIVKQQGWIAPLYWQQRDGEWYLYTLNGLKKLNETEPVVHVSYYEADAYARWRHTRLPTEAEWEHAACLVSKDEGNFLESNHLHPSVSTANENGLQQLLGDVWEWTMSPYTPYPGYVSAYDALGEYNGKFMSNQMVLRGGSCITPSAHIRRTYRNFFQADKRWQFAGIRLAKHGEEEMS